MAISVQSISTAQNDEAAVKDSTVEETISTTPVKDSTAQEATSIRTNYRDYSSSGTKFKANKHVPK